MRKCTNHNDRLTISTTCTWCRECKREYDRAYYEKTKVRRRERKNENSKNRRLRNKQFILEYLTNHPCIDCGESDIIVLEFDHIKDKFKDISDMIEFSQDKILQEIKKCEVRCANCHRRKTVKQFGYNRVIA